MRDQFLWRIADDYLIQLQSIELFGFISRGKIEEVGGHASSFITFIE